MGMTTGWYWYKEVDEEEGVLYWVYEGKAWYLYLDNAGFVTARLRYTTEMAGVWRGPLVDPFNPVTN